MKSNFVLRPWSMDDLDNLVKFANNEKISANLMDRFPYPYGIDDGRAFIERCLSQDPPYVLAIVVDKVAAGGIGVHPQIDIFKKNAELGYWLAEKYWGRGIMTQAVKQIALYGFDHFDIDRIFARPFGSNIASQKVLEKAGFVLEGRFEKTVYKRGAYHDELVYALRRSSLKKERDIY